MGVWWGSETWPIANARAVAREIEELGYGSLFFPEVDGKECFSQAAGLLGATDRLVIGTGVANIHVRIPSAAQTGSRTLHALYPGRFVLGLGVSHAPLVERFPDREYRKPLATMTEYLDRMDAVPADVEPLDSRPARLLASLGPKMLALSGSRADGAHPYKVTPAHTAATREILGPDKWIVVEQAVAVGGDADDQMRRARDHVGRYFRLTNYVNSWRRQGFDESDLVAPGSDRLVRALVGMGDVDSVAASVNAHLDAGADHVLVQVLGDQQVIDPLPQLRLLAPALRQ